MYDNFFPFGDSSAFAGHMFRVHHHNGNVGDTISFGEYLETLSIITRGRIEEKLLWAFQLYDHDGDGKISRADMTIVVDAIYRMLGSLVDFPEDEDTPYKRTEKLFHLMGMAEKDSINLEEFKEGIQQDASAIQSLLVYDGVV